MGYLATMMHRWLLVPFAVATAGLMSACTSTSTSRAVPATGGLEQLSVPLDLQSVEVADADGYRAVFLKLTKLPDGLTSRSDSGPARITVDIQGRTPEGASDETIPGDDPYVWQLRVLRMPGILRVIIDLQGENPPEYSVQQMADWIMVRLHPSS